MNKLFILLLGLMIANCGFTQSTPSPASDSTTSTEPTSSVQFSSGLLYYRNPETGQLEVPPPEIALAMQRDSLNFSDEGLEMVILPDGTKRIDLNGRFQMSSVIREGEEGTEHLCTSHPLTEHAAGEYHSHSDTPANDDER